MMKNALVNVFCVALTVLTVMAEEVKYDLVDNLRLPSGKIISRQMVVGYRGEASDEPENTREAVLFSVSRGFPVAVDVLTTKDGVEIASSVAANAEKNWFGELEKFDAGRLAVQAWPNRFYNAGYKIAKVADLQKEFGTNIVRYVRKGEKVEPLVKNPIDAVAAFEAGTKCVYSKTPAKLFTQLEGYLARKKVLATLKKRQIVAHAGGRELAPENTMPAFKNMQKGGFSVETDLYLSKDGFIFLTHEFILQRPKSGMHGQLSTNVMWRGELENADAGAWKDDKWKGLKYCLLDDMLNTIDGDRLIIFDMKDGRNEVLPKLKEILARHPNITPQNSIFLAPKHTNWFRKNLPGFRVAGCNLPRKGWMQHCEPHDMIARANDWKKDSTYCVYMPRWDNELITSHVIELFHAKGVEINVWSIEDPFIALAAFARGADTVSSDCPETLWAQMQSLK